MTLITTLLGGSWHWIAALAAVIAALGASYFGGKKIGKVQQKRVLTSITRNRRRPASPR